MLLNDALQFDAPLPLQGFPLLPLQPRFPEKFASHRFRRPADASQLGILRKVRSRYDRMLHAVGCYGPNRLLHFGLGNGLHPILLIIRFSPPVESGCSENKTWRRWTYSNDPTPGLPHAKSR